MALSCFFFKSANRLTAKGYFRMVMIVIVGVIISLLAVIALGSAFGSFDRQQVSMRNSAAPGATDRQFFAAVPRTRIATLPRRDL